MDSKLALAILLQQLRNIKDLKKPENKWILHCLFVGQAAGRIARALNLNVDYARTIGYMHDIGRIIDHSNHTIEGYRYLDNLGYPEIGRYCLTHSFIDNIIPNTAGGGPKDKESYNFIKNYLDSIDLNIYDNIVQLCDLFCLETGYTTFEKRILDITKRKGVYPNSLDHLKSIIVLRERIEKMMGRSIYSLFPEIKQADLDNIDKDYKELIELINSSNNIKRK